MESSVETGSYCWAVIIQTIYAGDSPEIISIHPSSECAQKALTAYTDGPNGPHYYSLSQCNPEILKIPFGKSYGVTEALFQKATNL